METGTLTVTLGTDWEGEGASPPREIPDEVSAGPGISPITMKCLEIEITVIKKSFSVLFTDRSHGFLSMPHSTSDSNSDDKNMVPAKTRSGVSWLRAATPEASGSDGAGDLAQSDP